MYRILVVDNENLICDTCRIALGNLGHEVFCSNEERAVEIAKSTNFDLAVVNILPEQMTGIDVFEQIRQSSPTLAGILDRSDRS